MIKAIETRYKGYRFRSRLEARWAVFFDALGVEWEYEKEGYDLGEAGMYLPSFWLPEKEVFFEVKGDYPSDAMLAKIESLSSQLSKGILVPIGTIEKHRWLKYSVEISPVFIEVPQRTPRSFVESSFCHDNPYFEDGELGVHCPVCGFDFVHFGTPSFHDGHDDGKAWRGRGDAIKLPMWCENGHDWTFVVGGHKGHTSLTFETVMQSYDNDGDLPGLWLARYNGDAMRNAYAAAKSARFEHGEQG